jgi:tetratricopeptide (TPR) repeat protein
MKRLFIGLGIVFVVLACVLLFINTKSKPSESEDIIANRGFDLLIAGKPQEALIELNKAYPLADTDRKKASIMAGKANAYERLNEPEEALKCYDTVIKSIRGDGESLVIAYIIKAYLLHKLGLIKEARLCAKEAKVLNTYPWLQEQLQLLEKRLAK